MSLHNPWQHGIKAERSRLSQLLDHYDEIVEALKNKLNVDIHRVFKRSLTSVTVVLYRRIYINGVSEKVGSWIYNLTNRPEHVFVNLAVSRVTLERSSVPKELHLYLCCFSFSHLIEGNTNHSFISFSADDTRIYMDILSIEDIEKL